MQEIILLGAAGSIGRHVIDVVLANQDRYKIIAMSLGRNTALANHLIELVKPEYVTIRDEVDPFLIQFKGTIFQGDEGLNKLAKLNRNALFINALVGDVGLLPTIEAIKTKKNIALANKETLVLAGSIIKALAKEYSVKILPIDSEHTAILSLLNNEKRSDLKKVIITASGGSLRDKTRSELVNISVSDVLNHPNWQMGAKITVDSATMANKAFEVVEAIHLFDLKKDEIDVVLHKESLVHSIVEFKDNTYHFNVSHPDMHFAINYALSYPTRLANDYEELDFTNLNLHFQTFDYDRYPLLKLMFSLLDQDPFKLVQFNASNDLAVELFLANKISFLEIERIIFKFTDIDYSDLAYNISNILKVNKEIKELILKEYV